MARLAARGEGETHRLCPSGGGCHRTRRGEAAWQPLQAKGGTPTSEPQWTSTPSQGRWNLPSRHTAVGTAPPRPRTPRRGLFDVTQEQTMNNEAKREEHFTINRKCLINVITLSRFCHRLRSGNCLLSFSHGVSNTEKKKKRLY